MNKDIGKLKKGFKHKLIKRLEKKGKQTQLIFIKYSIKGMNDSQLDELLGKVLNYPSSNTKQEILGYLKNEFNKRKIERSF